ncbi:MAG: DNA polymerase I [Pleurocapsa minor GSE-CHR-MK-17-07R]|jgi:DNA polymerase-1|nr:DNA polymerase I [Pleurocapsa minor GSE-CHR-MK 17-07R]
MARPLFYVLDGHALAYRHYFANNGRPLKTSTGIITSAIYGFTRTIIDVLEKERPVYMAVAFDEGLSGRDEYYPAYKAHREATPEDFEVQLPYLLDIVRAFGIPLMMKPNHEADDLIGTATRIAAEQGAESIVFSGDRDLLQLLDEHTRVRLYIPMAGVPDELYDTAKFRAKYELDPLQLIDLKALEGDTSDNIPGVSGIGRKGATTLLQQYGTVEGIYAHLAEIKEGTRKKLEAGREMADISKRLATILRDVEFEFSLEACALKPVEREGLEALFRTLEFTSLLKTLDKMTGTASPSTSASRSGSGPAQMSMFGESVAAPEPVATPALYPTTIVQDLAGLDALADALAKATLIAVDTEATGIDPMLDDLVGLSFSVDGEHGWYVPVGHREGTQLPIEVVFAALRPALTDPAIPKVAHNANYDALLLEQHGLSITPITYDTMVMEWVRDPLSSYLGLKKLAARDLHVMMTEISELIGKGKNQISMAEVPIETAAPYAGADAVCTWLLTKKLDADLKELAAQSPAQDPLWEEPAPTVIDVLETLEMPLLPVLMAMEQTGVLLDTAFLKEMSGRLQVMLADLETEIHGMAGGPFNINSPKQLNDILFGVLGLKAEGIRKTTHGFSTAADVLEDLRGDHAIIDKILNFRELSKLKGTYVDALPALIHPRTGRLHTSFNQTGTSTGRMSSSNPNLQNIPIRTETGREVRGAFIAQEGWKLLSVDYSQVELRIMAHITQEPTLLEAFHQGQDIHAATAALVNRIPIEQVTKEQRSFAKRVNFGILYGMGAFRLSRDSDLTLHEADAFINEYFARLPKVKQYLTRAKQLASGENGYLCTLFGRRRTFPALQGSGNRQLKQAAEREAINMPIQGTAADIIKRAMITLHDELRKAGTGARILLQVHDELVVETPDAAAHDTAALVVRVMESAADLTVPLKTNASIGQNWREMEDVAL